MAAQSSIFSMIVRGSPANVKRPKRVPPAVSAHDGSATPNSSAAVVSVSISTPRRARRISRCE